MREKRIPGYEHYTICEDGTVWSWFHDGRSRRHVIKPFPSHNGYWRVRLYRNGRRRNWFVHRLVLETFVGSCPPGMETRHMDGDQNNNHRRNLKWGTKSENMQDAVRHGTHPLLAHNRTP